MNSQKCRVSGCPFQSNTDCSCPNQACGLCITHHLSAFPGVRHSLSASYALLEEWDRTLLKQIRSSLRKRVQAKQAYEFQKMQAIIQPLMAQYKAAVQTYSRQVNNVLRYYSELRNQLREILDTQLLGQTNAFAQELLNLKRTQDGLHIQSVESLLGNYGLHETVWATRAHECIVSNNLGSTVCYTGGLSCELRGPYTSQWCAFLSTGPGRLVVGGGDRHGTTSNQVFAVYPRSGEFIQLPSLLEARALFAFASCGYQIVAIGGRTREGVTNACEVLGEDAWTPFAPLLTPRSGHSATSYGSKIFVAGGNNSQYLDLIEQYDPEQRWQTLPLRLPTPCVYLGLIALSLDQLLIAGGSIGVNDGRWRNLNTVHIGDTSMNTWIQLDPLPASLSFVENTWILTRHHVESVGWSDTRVNVRIRLN